jgi:hypothetical protein
MNGINIVLDTNALIAVLNGNDIAVELINGNNLYVSFIVELESQSYQKLTSDELKNVRGLLGD